jgi:endonuclease-8
VAPFASSDCQALREKWRSAARCVIRPRSARAATPSEYAACVPEGDTIHKLAAVLAGELVGRELSGGRVRVRPDVVLAARRVESVAARGKHLFVELGPRDTGVNDDGLVVQSHLGLHGGWYRFRPGEPWTRGPRGAQRDLAPRADLVLETAQLVYVCHQPKEVALLARGDAQRFVAARRLGPDLVDGAPSAAELHVRMTSLAAPDAPLVDVLLDQRIAAGIGNVHAQEALFGERLHPLTPWSVLANERLFALFERARLQLTANLGPGPRTTRAVADGRGALFVYGRAGEPCFECGAPLEHGRLGRVRRATTWCAHCQPAWDALGRSNS